MVPDVIFILQGDYKQVVESKYGVILDTPVGTTACCRQKLRVDPLVKQHILPANTFRNSNYSPNIKVARNGHYVTYLTLSTTKFSMEEVPW